MYCEWAMKEDNELKTFLFYMQMCLLTTLERGWEHTKPRDLSDSYL